MGLFKKQKVVETDDYFDMDLDNDNLTMDSYENNLLDDETEIDDSQGKGRKGRKTGKGHNVVSTIVSVLGIVAVVAVVLVAGYLIFSLITGPSKKQCNAMITNFQIACNEGDISGMADCLEPSLANKIKAAVIILPNITGADLQELLKLAINGMGRGLFPSNESENLPDVFETISIEPIKYGFPGRKRVVKCRVSCMGIDLYWNITVAKKEGKCFIDHVELVK